MYTPTDWWCTCNAPHWARLCSVQPVLWCVVCVMRGEVACTQSCSCSCSTFLAAPSKIGARASSCDPILNRVTTPKKVPRKWLRLLFLPVKPPTNHPVFLFFPEQESKKIADHCGLSFVRACGSCVFQPYTLEPFCISISNVLGVAPLFHSSSVPLVFCSALL